MYLKRYMLSLVYLLVLMVFHTFINYLDFTEYFTSKTSTEADFTKKIYDYIVVGAGSAGAIVARRLAEDKNDQVLVLETGKHVNKLLEIPSLGVVLQKTQYDWQYKTVPQKKSCFALDDNISHWPRGKIVGGTSMLNNLIYIRGHPSDYDEWFERKEGYNYTKDILPYFERLEISPDNTGGSVYVDDLPYITELPNMIMKALKDLGLIMTNNIKTVEQGFGVPKVNIVGGRRWTTASHFIYSLPSNVLLRTNAIVELIRFHDNFEAYGVEFSYSGNKYLAKASKGIILSAGVIDTPKILMRSGVGPRKHLNEVGIAPKVDLPVGENLQDHITTGFDLVLLNNTLDIGIGTMLSPSSILSYLQEGRGPWTTIGCELVGFIDTTTNIPKQNDFTRPDLQLMIMPLGIVEDSGFHLRKLMGISDYTWNRYFSALSNESTVTFLPVLLHPKSRGYIRLRDKNADSDPVINPRYLSHRKDVDLLVKGIRFVQKLLATKEMQKIGARLNTNVFPGCESQKFDTYSYWECYVRHLTITSYHPIGTCKMGHEKDPSAVVNYNFEVKGTNKLFVVDGSVLPTLPSGNPYASIMMLAEMASDLIKAKDALSHARCDIREVFHGNRLLQRPSGF